MAKEVKEARKYNPQSKLVEFTIEDADGHVAVHHANPLSSQSIQEQIDSVLDALNESEAARAAALEACGLK